MGILKDYLPADEPFVPTPIVSIVSMTERPVGLGNYVGTELQGKFAAVQLKGVRLDVLARFQLWASDLAVETAANDLNTRLLADHDALWKLGFRRLALEASSQADLAPTFNAWSKQVDYRVLYEHQYIDNDDAESLIARILIDSDQEVFDSPQRETTVVTDLGARWDNLAAPHLAVYGRTRVGGLSALVFIPGLAPAGSVTITRGFDGATGLPANQDYTVLADFLAAVAGPAAPQRHARMTFASFSDFLAAFSTSSDPVTLGDWDEDGVPDGYEVKSWVIEPAISLPGVADYLEIAYQDPVLERVAVVYLRVTGGQ
jgi:hypothetical protein